MKPERIQLRRTKGWKMPPNTVNVARPTLWGNPFFVSKWRDVATCIALFRNSVTGHWNPATSDHLTDAWCGYSEHTAWLDLWRKRRNQWPIEAIDELRGKNLACWCKPGTPCHADVLLELANGQTRETL